MPQNIALDVAAVGRISAVPGLLQILCQNTKMGFAAVARVTDDSWTACAVEDRIGFGLRPGGQLDVHTTLCKEARALRQPVVIDQASADPVYFNHHTPRIYNIESYVSVPIVLSSGEYFGNLCAIDPHPAKVSDPQTVAMFTSFAQLIANQLEHESQQQEVETALMDERSKAVLREQFIAVLGHDLRNPLSAITSLADLMVLGAKIDTVVSGRRIKAGARRMSRLIDDVLDFTRGSLGSGMGIDLATRDDVTTALLDIVAEAQESHPGHAIVAQVAIDQPVRCDRQRLQQLLSNLLGNALHHGAADQVIEVDARIVGGQLHMSVKNGGVPIAPQHLAKIFEPYWRPSTTVQAGGGLGLGLNICAQIVKAHRGHIDVTSSERDGTRFMVTLPIG